MKNIFSILTIITSVVWSAVGFSQEAKYNFPNELQYKSIRIQTYAGKTLEGKQLTLVPASNSVRYSITTSADQMELQLKEINAIDIQKGNHAFIYGLVGFGVGVTAFYLIHEANNWGDPFNDVSSKTISSTFFITSGIGIGLGVAIGAGKKKYKKIFINGSFVNY
jgi:hypothetical protein